MTGIDTLIAEHAGPLAAAGGFLLLAGVLARRSLYYAQRAVEMIRTYTGGGGA